MKTVSTIFFVIFITACLPAQFGPPQLISLPSDTPTGRQYIRTADVDSDGKPDILVASSFNNVVRYFHNRGNFTFDAPTVLPGVWKDLHAFEAADLNSDGNPDLVTLDIWEHKLFWHPNKNGTFPQQILIIDSLATVFSRILCKDFNGDGHTDIVILSHFNALLFLNDGAGNFATPQNIVAPF